MSVLALLGSRTWWNPWKWECFGKPGSGSWVERGGSRAFFFPRWQSEKIGNELFPGCWTTIPCMFLSAGMGSRSWEWIKFLGMDLIVSSEHECDVRKTRKDFFFIISERIFLALFDSQRGFIHLQDPRVISLFSLSHSLIYWIRFFFTLCK